MKFIYKVQIVTIKILSPFKQGETGIRTRLKLEGPYADGQLAKREGEIGNGSMTERGDTHMQMY